MPLKKCTIDNKAGYKWGDAGKCYTGPEGKKKAIKQGVAVEGPEKFSQKALEQNIFLSTDDIKAVADSMYEQGYNNAAVVATVSTLTVQADKIAGYPPNCNDGYEAQDGKCVPIKDVEAKHKSKYGAPTGYKDGGPVCPEGHTWDDETEECVPAGEEPLYEKDKKN